MSPPPSSTAVPAAARGRILDGAIRTLARQGPNATMADIAAEAGVSKALLHYHYTDRAHLLALVVDRLAGRLGRRERAAAEHATPGDAVDALWRWVEGELRLGELRVLLELGVLREAAVRASAERAALARRASAAISVTRLFESLGLTPRVPAALLADANVAFIDGLALDAGNGRDPRVSFDVFWLALLNLAE